MTSEREDRVAVPTNGHRPPLSTDDTPLPADPAPPDPSIGTLENDAGPPDGEREADPRIAFSPGQVAAGFGILAALILLVAGRRRTRG